MDADFSKCLASAERILSIREHCRAELFSKLEARGFERGTITSVIDALEEEGLFSEERFIRCFIRSNNARHPEGKRVLFARLLQKGADKALSGSILDEIYTDEYEALQCKEALHKAKRKGKDEEKILSSLSRAGFSFSLSKRLYNSEFGTI